jgi:hypothetical protein
MFTLLSLVHIRNLDIFFLSSFKKITKIVLRRIFEKMKFKKRLRPFDSELWVDWTSLAMDRHQLRPPTNTAMNLLFPHVVVNLTAKETDEEVAEDVS